MEPAESEHANPLDTPTNHSSLLKVMAWLLAVFAILFFFARSATKWAASKKFGLDDVFILLAIVSDLS